MTTLGDVFGKLSGVKLISILKWYGRIVFWTFFVCAALALLTGVVMLVYALVVSLPWWFTVGLLFLGSAWVALKIADPDALKSDFDRHMDALDREILMRGAAQERVVSTKPVNTWEQVREVVNMMKEDQACNVVLDGHSYHFENKQAALDFLDGKSTAQPFL